MVALVPLFTISLYNCTSIGSGVSFACDFAKKNRVVVEDMVLAVDSAGLCFSPPLFPAFVCVQNAPPLRSKPLFLVSAALATRCYLCEEKKQQRISRF